MAETKPLLKVRSPKDYREFKSRSLRHFQHRVESGLLIGSEITKQKTLEDSRRHSSPPSGGSLFITARHTS